MSKKLIAVAAASALALSALVAAPASAAAAITVVDTGAATVTSAATTKSTAATSPAAAVTNALTFGSTGTVVRFTVENPLATSATITVNSDLGVRVLAELTDAAGAALKVGAGSTTLTGSDSTATNNFVFYAYTTSTTAGSVSVNMAGNTTVYWVKGTAGAAYSLANVKFPTSITGGTTLATTKDVISYEITDVFGNKLENAASGVTVAALGAAVEANGTFSSTKKVYESKVHTSTGASVAMSLKVNGGLDYSADGLAAPVDSAFSTVSAADLATQVKNLTAQVATLQAALAASVTKAKYNKLAKRWNRANPSNKVKLVK